MAYGLKYQSDFYNYFGKLVSVKIYKEDYSDSVETDLRLSEVKIECNYKNDNTPLVGTGAKIVVVADSLDMSYLEDMMLSYERQFLCIIEHNSEIVFRGYSICDMNERQLLPYAYVTLEFTDYLHRLEEHYQDLLKNMGGNTDVLTLVMDYINLTTSDLPLYVNSTLFEDSMDVAATDTFLPQVTVQNAQFYSNSYQYDNAYDVINKTLHPFSAFLYYYKDMWVLERQEDITRVGDWVYYESNSTNTGETASSLKAEYNKQNEDFSYVDMSQIIEYDSGLHTLILALHDKIIDTFVFNDYTTDMLSVADATPDADSLEKNTWYKYTTVTIDEIGTNFRGAMDKYVKWTTDDSLHGLAYNFEIQFNGDYGADTQLTINFLMSGLGLESANLVKVRFYLRIDGGDQSDNYLMEGDSGNFILHPFFPATPQEIVAISSRENNFTSVFSISKTINFTDLWEDLGYPKTQKFTIIFLPLQFWETLVWEDATINYLGDISVSVNEEEIENKIEYHLNENFVKKDEIDLYLFDLDNINYSNGLELLDGTRTNQWTSEDSTIPIPLYEVFAKCKFRKYGRTIHRLKGTILADKVLKPFSILTDDNILDVNDNIITFLLNRFTWDLDKGTYDIEAEEYTEEEIIVAGVTYDSSGNPETEDPPVSAPANLFATLLPAFGHPIRVTWDPVGGSIIGYKLQRKPYYANAQWNDVYVIPYIGVNTQYIDYIHTEAPPVGGAVVMTYRVCAYNAGGDGPYSAEFNINWTY